MTEALYWLIPLFEWLAVLYMFVVSSIYLLLLLTGFFEVLRLRVLGPDAIEVSALHLSYLMPPVSIIAPAFNEAATIRESVRAMLSLDYPQLEVVIVNDGSKDETLDILKREFRLYRSLRYFEAKLPSAGIRAIYESMDPIPLVVVDKVNGGKADSLNAGINVAAYPLICAVDSDSLLEPSALLRVARPFAEDPVRTIAVGGTIRVVNGCAVSGGRVERVRIPDSWIARFQVVEYLRAFLGGRVAFGVLNSLLVVSGAFGLFSKSAVIECGGYRTSTVGEDMELIVRLHHWARRQKRPYRIVYEPEPVCWTEVPESLKILRRQRNRWQRGTIETVWMHRGMLLRPAYGVLGLFTMPYFVLFEMFGPLVELAGYILTVIGFLLGLFSWREAFLFFTAAVLYGVILSVSAVILEELSTRRYPKIKGMLTLIAAAILENLGFRQLLTVWRAAAFIDVWRGNKSWGAMERKGFETAA